MRVSAETACADFDAGDHFSRSTTLTERNDSASAPLRNTPGALRWASGSIDRRRRVSRLNAVGASEPTSACAAADLRAGKPKQRWSNRLFSAGGFPSQTLAATIKPELGRAKRSAGNNSLRSVACRERPGMFSISSRVVDLTEF